MKEPKPRFFGTWTVSSQQHRVPAVWLKTRSRCRYLQQCSAVDTAICPHLGVVGKNLVLPDFIKTEYFHGFTVLMFFSISMKFTLVLVVTL